MTIIKNIKALMLSAAIVCLTAGCFTACSDDDPKLPGNGIEKAQWADVNDVNINGQTLIYEFDAPARWHATADNEEWVHILTPDGNQGLSSLRIKVDPNEGTLGRTSTVKIDVEGYADPCILTLRQGEGILERGDGRYREVNKWIYDYMDKRYLWNEPISELQLDYTIDYQKFLDQMLNGIAGFDNVNAEDGHWANGQREYWYTNIESSAPLSRTAGETSTDSGLAIMGATVDTNDGKAVGFATLWCTPGSPAAEEDIKRGQFISKVNSIEVTMQNYRDLGAQVINGNCTIDVNDIEFSSAGIATLTPVKSVFIGKWSYNDPSIYGSRILTTTSGKKVAYLNYMGFHMNYDNALIDIFRQFKEAGVNDLILDLRYNPGGHVLSSTVLGTLIAGSAHKGEIYVRTTYNKTRTEAGEVGDYKIGEPENPELVAGYDKITQALTQSLGLSTVYVITSETTASASELVINGLRGLGVTVNTIGLTTNGKNVGMEGVHYVYRNYDFWFYPITFYCQNAKGFKDYSEGFAPDFEYDDSNLFPCEFGTEKDAYSYFALQWINSGTKPSTSKASRAASGNFRQLPMTQEMKSPMTRRLGGNIQIREM